MHKEVKIEGNNGEPNPNDVKLEGDKPTKRRRLSQDTYKSLETKDSGPPAGQADFQPGMEKLGLPRRSKRLYGRDGKALIVKQEALQEVQLVKKEVEKKDDDSDEQGGQVAETQKLQDLNIAKVESEPK